MACAPISKEPHIVFFSGGTALGPLAAALARKACRVTYIITPFDSGGSSAVLREAFTMPAVGDMRARLLALADTDEPDIADLVFALALRLPPNDAPTLRALLKGMVAGEDPLIADLAKPMRECVRSALGALYSAMPDTMPLAGACVGNLVLAGGYLEHQGFGPILKHLARLLRIRDTVLPVTPEYAHLCVQLQDDTLLTGQDRFTGKAYAPIQSAIRRVWLSAGRDDPTPKVVTADGAVCAALHSADLICYPVGSFYSSIIANLLVDGIVPAIAGAPCPKVFVPNPCPDPELFGHTLHDECMVLARILGAGKAHSMGAVLNMVLLDAASAQYHGGVPAGWLGAQQIQPIDAPLVSAESYPRIDPEPFAEALIRLALEAPC